MANYETTTLCLSAGLVNTEKINKQKTKTNKQTVQYYQRKASHCQQVKIKHCNKKAQVV